MIEPDPTDAFSSDLRSSGGCRVQFTVPEHIDRSLFGIDFVRDSGTTMSTPGQAAQADWIEGGDLLIVPSGIMANLERNARVQQSRGATADALAPHESADRSMPVEVRSESVRSRPIRCAQTTIDRSLRNTTIGE